jgi:hypothetical protein
VSSATSRAAGSHPETDRFLRALREEFPRFRIISKAESPLSRLIDVVLRLLTLGGQRHYLTRYHTVIGDTLYVPEVWSSMTDKARVILLRHERIHLLQRRRFGFPLFAFLYLVPFLPLGLAYARARLEWEAYRETLRATAELRGRSALHAPELRQQIVERFTGPDYGWMWPFPSSVNRWFDQALAELEPSFDAERRA